jgi:hypothetical protein
LLSLETPSFVSSLLVLIPVLPEHN